jgi:hypothetical protein
MIPSVLYFLRSRCRFSRFASLPQCALLVRLVQRSTVNQSSLLRPDMKTHEYVSLIRGFIYASRLDTRYSILRTIVFNFETLCLSVCLSVYLSCSALTYYEAKPRIAFHCAYPPIIRSLLILPWHLLNKKHAALDQQNEQQSACCWRQHFIT